MLNAIKVLHFQGETAKLDPELIEEPGSFVLKTCQRAIILKTTPFSKGDSTLGQLFESKDAYHFLLETICGLKSKLQGESEIVSQFKEAYQAYLKEDVRSSIILRVLEKLFKDAKEIRRDYLIKIGQQSYAGIARKIVQTKNQTGKVLILGSGQLASDVTKQLEKKFEIFISARSESKVLELKAQFPKASITYVPWEDHKMYQSFMTIINTIGADLTLFNHSFFAPMCPKNSLFIDLGSPSVIQTTKNVTHGVFRLEDIFNHGKSLDQEKAIKINKAHCAIRGIVEKRAVTLGHNYPFSWDELQFAY